MPGAINFSIASYTIIPGNRPALVVNPSFWPVCINKITIAPLLCNFSALAVPALPHQFMPTQDVIGGLVRRSREVKSDPKREGTTLQILSSCESFTFLSSKGQQDSRSTLDRFYWAIRVKEHLQIRGFQCNSTDTCRCQILLLPSLGAGFDTLTHFSEILPVYKFTTFRI